MYIVGDPCSQCPSGTQCSETFPGLCHGIPDEPLTIRPPVITADDSGFPTFEEAFGNSSSGFENPEWIETFVIPPPLIDVKNSSCVYECRENGGCSVKVETSKLISGPVYGSCFPPDFGGECSGIPELCSPCLMICSEFPGQELVVHVDENGMNNFERCGVSFCSFSQNCSICIKIFEGIVIFSQSFQSFFKVETCNSSAKMAYPSISSK